MANKIKTSTFEAEYEHKNGFYRWTAKTPFNGGATFFFALKDADYNELTKEGLQFDNNAILRGVGDFCVIFSSNKEAREQFNALNGMQQTLALDACGAIHNDMLNGADKDALLAYFKDKNDGLSTWVKAYAETLIDAGQQVIVAPFIFKLA